MRISDWSSDVCSSDLAAAWAAVAGPLGEFFRRKGAMLVLLFVLLHKIGDTLANLTFRLLLNDLGFSNTEIATYDVGVGFATMLMGIFVGGILYARMGLKARSEEHTSELQSLMRISYAVFCLKKKNKKTNKKNKTVR